MQKDTGLQRQRETFVHRLWECACAATVWNELIGHWTGQKVNPSVDPCLFGDLCQLTSSPYPRVSSNNPSGQECSRFPGCYHLPPQAIAKREREREQRKFATVTHGVLFSACIELLQRESRRPSLSSVISHNVSSDQKGLYHPGSGLSRDFAAHS